MRSYDEKNILERLHRLERQARWHWVERCLALVLLVGLVIARPLPFVQREKPAVRAEYRHSSVSHTSRLETFENWLLGTPELDPETVAEDVRDAESDASLSELGAMSETAEARSLRPAVSSESAPSTHPALQHHASSRTQAAATARSADQPAPVTDETASSLPFQSVVREAEINLARSSERRSRSFAALLGAGSGASRRDPFQFAGAPLAPAQNAVAALPNGMAPSIVGSIAELPPSVAGSASPDVAGVPLTTTESAIGSQPSTLRALGFSVSSDGTAQAVLTDSNSLYVVGEGEEFAGRYRVIGIRPEGLEVEDEIAGQTLQLTFGSQP